MTAPLLHAIRKLPAVSLLMLSCAFAVAPRANSEAQEIYIVSLVRLLAQPAEFENRVVRVSGYLESGLGLRLYLTRDHARIADSASSVMVKNQSEQLVGCAGAYVTLTGLIRVPEGGPPEVSETHVIDRWSGGDVQFSTCWRAP